MFALRPGPDVIEDQVIFRLEPVRLCSTPCERIQNDDPGPRIQTDRWRVLPGDEDAKLMDDRGGKRGFLGIKKLIFPIAKIRRHFRQIAGFELAVAAPTDSGLRLT